MRISDWSSDVCSSISLGAVLHKLHRGANDAAMQALDCNLTVGGAGQTGEASRPAAVHSAVMHHQDGTAEGVADCIAGADIGCHIPRPILISHPGPFEGMPNPPGGPPLLTCGHNGAAKKPDKGRGGKK